MSKPNAKQKLYELAIDSIGDPYGKPMKEILSAKYPHLSDVGRAKVKEALEMREKLIDDHNQALKEIYDALGV